MTTGKVRSALVLGVGRSGQAAAELLLAEGARVAVIDSGADAVSGAGAERLRAAGATVNMCAPDALPDAAVELAVVSPGVPETSFWVRTLRQRGVPAISELELGWSRAPWRVLAVTGSNGKSTLVKLCADALAAGGQAAVCAGNYGTPLCRVVLEGRRLDWCVAEVSSFQLECVDAFRPEVGVLLNLHPNHLDRHGSMTVYAERKARLFRRMQPGQTGIVPAAQAEELRRAAGCNANWVTFGDSSRAAYRYGDGYVAAGAGGRAVDVRGTWFGNEVMGLTAAAACAAVEACGVDARHVAEAAQRFEPLAHRMQEVAVVDDVRFVDDSKATNLAALSAALRMSAAPVRLIAGGLAKERDFDSVGPELKERVLKAYLIGASASALTAAWGGYIRCEDCGELARAVSRAFSEARAGETILLSPACASFDQFGGYGERGDRFVALVRALSGRKER